MSLETEALRQDIEGIRGSMTETLEYLETRLRRTMDSTVEQVRQGLDLERQVRERPWTALGLAALAGYILGSMDEEREGFYTEEHDAPPRPQNGMSDELGAIATAATTTATAFLREALRGSLPHFDEEYERLRREQG